MGKIYLKKEERALLFQKYRKKFDVELANKKVNEFQDRLIELYRKLKAEKKSEEDINTKFKIEFENLLRRVDAQNGEK